MCPGRTSLRVARPEGLEPPTLCLEGRRSIQLSYGRILGCYLILQRLARQFELQLLPGVWTRDKNLA